MSSLFFILPLKPVFKSMGWGYSKGGGKSDFPFTPHNYGNEDFFPLPHSLFSIAANQRVAWVECPLGKPLPPSSAPPP